MIGSINNVGFVQMPQDLAATRLAGPAPISDPGKLDSGTQTQGANKTFSSVLEQAVQEVDQKIKTSGEEQVKLMTGQTNNIHQAMIAMQESGVAFSLMVEVRNKLVESYQELMRMQI